MIRIGFLLLAILLYLVMLIVEMKKVTKEQLLTMSIVYWFVFIAIETIDGLV